MVGEPHAIRAIPLRVGLDDVALVGGKNTSLGIRSILDGVRKDDAQDLVRRGKQIRALVLTAPMPRGLFEEIDAAYLTPPQRTLTDLLAADGASDVRSPTAGERIAF
jgi:hypothetical protein